MRKSIYLLTTTPSSHTHTFYPLSTIVIHTLNFAQVKSRDDNGGEWVECMGVASECGELEVGVASGSGQNPWVWLLGLYRFPHTTYHYSSCICSFYSIPTCSFF